MAKMSSSANHPVCVGTSALPHLGPDPHESETRRPEQVLDGPARDHVRAERADVELDRPARLVAVGKHDRAGCVGRLRDRADVVPMPRAVGERRAADERRPLVDRLGEPLRRDLPVRAGVHVDDLRSAELLRMRDLADGRELVLADHDPVPLAVERQCRDERAHSLRDRGRDGDVIGLGVEQARDRGAERLVPLDPEVPLGAVRVPAGEPLLDGVRGRDATAPPASTS